MEPIQSLEEGGKKEENTDDKDIAVTETGIIRLLYEHHSILILTRYKIVHFVNRKIQH